jgi:hypothetical protein
MGVDGAAEKVTSIGVGSKPWSNKLRKTTKTLARKIDEAQFELGVLLWRVYDTPIDGKEENNPVFMSWGYSTWKEYVETELGLQSRKAERLRLIGKVLDVDMKHLPKTQRDRFVKLGWSKAREVARIFRHQADEPTVNTWLDFAENNNYPATLHTVSKKMDAMDFDEDGNYVPPTTQEVDDPPPSGDVGVLPEVERTHMFNFFCIDEQIDTLRDALTRAEELAKAQGDPNTNYKKSNLMSLICLDFLATNEFAKKGDPKTVTKFVKRFEQAMGVKIVALRDTDDGLDILHGLQHVKQLAEELSEES